MDLVAAVRGVTCRHTKCGTLQSLRQGELHTTTGTGSQQGGRAFFKTTSSGW